MRELWYINAVKWFASAVFAIYVGAMLYPWILIATGYIPPSNPGDSLTLSPFEFALGMSTAIFVYGGMFAFPLLIASLYTIRSLRTKYNAKMRTQ